MASLPVAFVTQLIIFYKEVFEREGLDLWLKPYSILSTAKTTGLIEVWYCGKILTDLKEILIERVAKTTGLMQ